ncbi:hypothetical protein MKZ38_010455 [Zalerion maritima]|uniref:Uncharacterized protein n=1 Tax=Zalerion maritima TaxID=339359 RepID=A0AAD5WM24_9PEZI|nr:hypothetical protein MKZ38_010455 [Zalerion maritima]
MAVIKVKRLRQELILNGHGHYYLRKHVRATAKETPQAESLAPATNDAIDASTSAAPEGPKLAKSTKATEETTLAVTSTTTPAIAVATPKPATKRKGQTISITTTEISQPASRPGKNPAAPAKRCKEGESEITTTSAIIVSIAIAIAIAIIVTATVTIKRSQAKKESGRRNYTQNEFVKGKEEIFAKV